MCVPKFVFFFNIIMFVYVLLLARVYIYVYSRIFWNTSLRIYTYFRCLLLGRGETKEESVRRKE